MVAFDSDTDSDPDSDSDRSAGCATPIYTSDRGSECRTGGFATCAPRNPSPRYASQVDWLGDGVVGPVMQYPRRTAAGRQLRQCPQHGSLRPRRRGHCRLARFPAQFPSPAAPANCTAVSFRVANIPCTACESATKPTHQRGRRGHLPAPSCVRCSSRSDREPIGRFPAPKMARCGCPASIPTASPPRALPPGALPRSVPVPRCARKLHRRQFPCRQYTVYSVRICHETDPPTGQARPSAGSFVRTLLVAQ